MIQRSVIHRFRGIRQGVSDDLGKANLLVGPISSDAQAFLRNLLGLEEEHNAV